MDPYSIADLLPTINYKTAPFNRSNILERVAREIDARLYASTTVDHVGHERYTLKIESMQTPRLMITSTTDWQSYLATVTEALELIARGRRAVAKTA
jgi:hypothetical protein